MTNKEKILNYYNNFKGKINNLKKKTEIFLAKRTYVFHLYISFMIGSIISNIPRLTYNGFFDTFYTNIFKLSYLGLAWGETPFYIQIITLIFVLTTAYCYAQYIIYIKNKHFYSGVTWS
tara:strand:- start:256 stop:612 length:357 start_codon:yes stop_codon:yes gene_type:complete